MVAGRFCGWCGTDIAHMGPLAAYCTRQHKKNAASKRHRERNPGYYTRYNGSPARQAWYAENAETIRAKAREQAAQYRKRNPDAAPTWWAANRDKHRLYQAARRARIASECFQVTDRDVRRLLARYRGMCAYCHERPAEHLDHVIPLKRGGRHSIGNLLPACARCNQSKNARLLYPWSVTRRLTAYYVEVLAA